MPRAFSIVIADTSCFILLHKINELKLLAKMFDSIYTTKEIEREFGKPLPKWVKIQSAKNLKLQRKLESEIDLGEASAIALAAEMKNALLILDDLKARNLAEHLHLDFTGTLGVFVRAKQDGIISSVKPIIEKIRTTNFRFSDKVYAKIMKDGGE